MLKYEYAAYLHVFENNGKWCLYIVHLIYRG